MIPYKRGLRRDCRTSANLFVMCNLVATQKNTYKISVCLLYRFDQSFRDAFTLKLQQCNVDGKYLNIIKYMFHKSSSRVKWNGKISKPIKNHYDVMQGGVSSPKLFNEFLQDLGK